MRKTITEKKEGIIFTTQKSTIETIEDKILLMTRNNGPGNSWMRIYLLMNHYIVEYYGGYTRYGQYENVFDNLADAKRFAFMVVKKKKYLERKILK